MSSESTPLSAPSRRLRATRASAFSRRSTTGSRRSTTRRLGILYVLYGIVFLAVGGVEATIMRIQLAVPNNHFVGAAGLQPDDDDARHDDGLPRGRADPLRLRQLPRAADGRRARHGVPAAERARLLADGVRRPAPLLQLPRRRGALRRGQRAGRRLVRLRAADGEGLLARPLHRLLDARDLRHGHRHDRHGDQHHHDDDLPALSGHEADADAAAASG